MGVTANNVDFSAITGHPVDISHLVAVDYQKWRRTL
jgi:hypothetical protein